MPLTAPPPAPPLISVCMPVYNAERYVAEAVESILGQTFGDFELLIEDNSTDSTTAILERYAARDRRIHVDIRPRRGLVAALNDLIDRARGEFLARMDADDIAMPDRFARQVAYLRGHPECVLVGSRVWEADAEGDPLGEYPTLSDHEEIDAFHFRMQGPALIHPSIMMRRDAVLAVGKYRGSQIEDVDLYLRLAERGRLARLPEFLLKYRIHANNASRSDDARMRSYQLLCEILGDAYRRRDLPVDLPPPEAMGFAPADPPCLERDRGWAWRSLSAGHPRTARKYARRVLARRPLSPQSWKLMYCALRGR
jgi:glycosyltransferase involved in cell wall biosynthesis